MKENPAVKVVQVQIQGIYIRATCSNTVKTFCSYPQKK